MSENRSPFAARLKSLRASAGMTQQVLASKAGMHKLGVAKLEQGLREPTWATVQALAEALGVEAGVFVVKDRATAEKKSPQMGRPRQAPAVAQEIVSEGKAATAPSGHKMPAPRQGRNRKGTD